MRKNKFRVWDNAEKRMLSHSDLIELDQETMCIYTALTDKRSLRENEWTKMQYTGLKDKNGVEIYEGDVAEDSINGYIGTVDYFEAYYCYNFENISEQLSECHMDLEVIGSIYENPELLEDSE